MPSKISTKVAEPRLSDARETGEAPTQNKLISSVDLETKTVLKTSSEHLSQQIDEKSAKASTHDEQNQQVCVRAESYEVIETLGEGGMGIVYKVRRVAGDQFYAMKVLRKELSGDPVSVKRFQQELKTTSLLTHPNIVPIYDSGLTEDKRPFFVMEFLDGMTLEELLMDVGFIDVDRLLEITAQVCDALEHAHEKRVVHRDLKPSNIILSSSGETELVKVVDFGIARVFQRASRDATTRMTQLGEIIGSPIYMSPEQCLSQRLDERSDIYSLGVIMYEALSGTLPFTGLNSVEILMGHLQEQAPSMRRVRPDFNIPPELEALIFSCLEKDPSLRPQSFKALSAELRKIGSARKTSTLLSKIRQAPIRFKNSAARYFKKGYKKHQRWYRATTAVSILATGMYLGFQALTQHTVQEYIDHATLAAIHDNYDQVSHDWEEAIALAQKKHESTAFLAFLNERAADEITKTHSAYCNMSVGNLAWTPLGARENQNGNEEYRAGLAKPYLEKALALTKEPSSQRRIKDKLFILANKLGLVDEELAYLKERNVDAQVDEYKTTRLAEIMLSKGNIAEATKLFTAVLHLQQEASSEPFPAAFTQLIEITRRTGKVEDEITLRKQIIASIRRSISKGSDYNYQLKEELSKLAVALTEVGKQADADLINSELARMKS